MDFVIDLRLIKYIRSSFDDRKIYCKRRTMALSLLRVDWYSFVAGTQICSLVGIVTSSVKLGLGLRFPREFLYPSFTNNGTTLFLFRMKQGSNWLRKGLQLICKVYEKHIVVGAILCALNSRYYSNSVDEIILKSFIFGGLCGFYAYLSYIDFDLRSASLQEMAICVVMAAELAWSLEELRIIIFLDRSPLNYELEIPYSLVTAFNGGLVSSVIGLEYSTFLSDLQDIVPPDFNPEEDETGFLESLVFVYDVYCCCLKFIFGMHERLLAGCVLQCILEFLVCKINGWECSFRTGILCGALHGIFLGWSTGKFKKTFASATTATLIFRTISFSHSKLAISKV